MNRDIEGLGDYLDELEKYYELKLMNPRESKLFRMVTELVNTYPEGDEFNEAMDTLDRIAKEDEED
jgi:hypothetical protein